MSRGKQIDGATLAVLNCYRNKYYAEGNNTEQGIVANAINEVLPVLVDIKENVYRKQSEGEWREVEKWFRECEELQERLSATIKENERLRDELSKRPPKLVITKLSGSEDKK